VRRSTRRTRSTRPRSLAWPACTDAVELRNWQLYTGFCCGFI